MHSSGRTIESPRAPSPSGWRSPGCLWLTPLVSPSRRHTSLHAARHALDARNTCICTGGVVHGRAAADCVEQFAQRLSVGRRPLPGTTGRATAREADRPPVTAAQPLPARRTAASSPCCSDLHRASPSPATTRRWTRCHTRSALASAALPSSVSRSDLWRASPTVTVSRNPRRSSGARFLVMVVRSRASRPASFETVASSEIASATRMLTCEMRSPVGRNASSNRAVIARVALRRLFAVQVCRTVAHSSRSSFGRRAAMNRA